jgi:hypothetical protein
MLATPAESVGGRNPGIRADGKHNHWPGTTERYGQAITGADVRAALAGLTAQQLQVIVEIYYHNRSVRETADLLRIPVSTVQSRAYAAVRHLRVRLPRSASCQALPTTSPAPPPIAANRAREFGPVRLPFRYLT